MDNQPRCCVYTNPASSILGRLLYCAAVALGLLVLFGLEQAWSYATAVGLGLS